MTPVPNDHSPDRAITVQSRPPVDLGPEDPFAADMGDDGAAQAGGTMLDSLASELQKVEREPVVIAVPERPGWAVRFRADIDLPLLDGWRRRATMPGPRGPEVDQVRWAELVVGGATLAILKDGQEVLDGGEPVTFRSKKLQQILGSADPFNAVRKFWGLDSHLTACATEVLRASGYDDELRPDPTQAS